MVHVVVVALFFVVVVLVLADRDAGAGQHPGPAEHEGRIQTPDQEGNVGRRVPHLIFVVGVPRHHVADLGAEEAGIN